MFLNRTIRTKFDLLRPDTAARVVSKQTVQKGHNIRAKARDFAVGQKVLARTLRPGPDWILARVVQKLGPVTYMVETGRDMQISLRKLQSRPSAVLHPSLKVK